MGKRFHPPKGSDPRDGNRPAFGDTRPVNPLPPMPKETIHERIIRLENEIIDRDINSRHPSSLGVQLIAARAQITG